ncbi:L,D-transpeptidase family protein [Actinosynnema pretiosum]|uniref:L,D-transpeptidase family protein n=1 Tax=Actinosynnema pretiosum TaxID=42197 RepID=UPI0022B75DFA|nr:L,D-transpeptidase family protein [Actinosynnema pretiosum]
MVLGVLGVLVAGLTPATAQVAAVAGLPLPYGGGADQVVAVVVDRPDATSGWLTGWRRDGAGWRMELGPAPAFVGSAGVGEASESSTRTPAGAHRLTESFGTLPPLPEGRLPYRRVDGADWWVSDQRSPLYNTHQRCEPGTCPFDESASERLAHVGPAYDRAIVIDYNRSPAVPGRGSAFFLHVWTGGPTAGCVSVDAPVVNHLLSWLDPAARPEVLIGVG